MGMQIAKEVKLVLWEKENFIKAPQRVIHRKKHKLIKIKHAKLLCSQAAHVQAVSHWRWYCEICMGIFTIGYWKHCCYKNALSYFHGVLLAVYARTFSIKGDFYLSRFSTLRDCLHGGVGPQKSKVTLLRWGNLPVCVISYMVTPPIMYIYLGSLTSIKRKDKAAHSSSEFPMRKIWLSDWDNDPLSKQPEGNRAS